ncbi:transcription initiation factor IIA gamma subunit, partial [Lentinula edodes]
IGIALTDSQDKLIISGSITFELTMKVLQQFDRSLTDTMVEQVKNKIISDVHLHTYRFCDDIWTFIVNNASFKMESNELGSTPKIKIIVCKNGEAMRVVIGDELFLRWNRTFSYVTIAAY